MKGKEEGALAGETGAEAWQRLSAYAYLSAPERVEYVAVMRVFCGTILADLAIPDLLAKLSERGGPGAALDAETLARRLEELVRWGNLLRSTHTVKATSISEYQRSRSRYQLSKLGERVQRDADEVLGGADAAREVSSELLALVDRGLREIAAMAAAPGGADPQQALERISTLFVQFAEFAESVRDFYAYLGQVLARYDLDSAEYQGFKELLLDYVEAITEDVSFRAPRIAAHLDAVRPHLPALLARIDAHATGIGALTDGLRSASGRFDQVRLGAPAMRLLLELLTMVRPPGERGGERAAHCDRHRRLLAARHRPRPPHQAGRRVRGRGGARPDPPPGTGGHRPQAE
ncbi:DUF2397 family protein [Streptomyces coelicoflavus]|uniref:DUF2397 family protein n=1 Tax=Streptomyces coelicoflavus TaxID=285562 RepID=UPI001FD47B6E|nr:DUF2397 family protein [Streptomyces coelicoflavus]